MIDQIAPIDQQETLPASNTPDVSATIQLALDLNPSEDLRKALFAENIGEMNDELDFVLSSLVGLKLLGMKDKDQSICENAEQLFVQAIGGDSEAQAILERAQDLASSHDKEVRSTRIQHRRDLLKEMGIAENESNSAERLTYKDLSIVHATNHEPVTHRTDGKRHIYDRYTADGTPRPTVHVALNHLVEGHSFSSDWDGSRVVVIAPMDEVVELNADPTSSIGHDTWWETAPGEGLILPDSTIIVKPGASRAVQVIDEKNEIRYKNQGIDASDVDELFQLSQDYEVAQIVNSLGLEFHLQYNHFSTGTLGDTGLAQYQTVLSSEQREQVRLSLKSLIEKSGDSGENVFTKLAKLVAVRTALDRQGRELIEPMTIMDTGFMSEEISEALNQLAFREGMNGHHSLSKIGILDKTIRYSMEMDGSIKESDIDRLKDEVKGCTDDLSLASLQMFYRLGLL